MVVYINTSMLKSWLLCLQKWNSLTKLQK